MAGVALLHGSSSAASRCCGLDLVVRRPAAQSGCLSAVGWTGDSCRREIDVHLIRVNINSRRHPALREPTRRRVGGGCRSTRAAAGEQPGPSSSKDSKLQLYGKIERVFSESARWSSGSSSGDWEEIEGAWVLRPATAVPVAVVHFVGGAFVGASPQLTYRLFLETLANRGVLIVATPYASGFDHLRIADEAQFRFDRCMRVLTLALPPSSSSSSSPSSSSTSPPYDGDLIRELPVYGVGHSMGALTHLLIGARYAVQRAGNVFLSFNNKEASKSIPLFSPVIMPMAQNLGPLLSRLLENPTLRFGADLALKQLRDVNSPMVAQVMPLIEQLPPLYRDLANGRDEFIPTPDETKNLVRSYYGVRRNFLIRFREDTIDETPNLADMLSVGSSVSDSLDLSIRTLPGDHARPLRQAVPDIPEAVARAVQQGSELFGSVAAASPLADLAKGFLSQSLGSAFGGSAPDLASAQRLRREILEDMETLVDEIAPWIGASVRPEANPVKLLS